LITVGILFSMGHATGWPQHPWVCSPILLRGFYKLFQSDKTPEGVMPMNIRELGNSSVGTIPVFKPD